MAHMFTIAEDNRTITNAGGDVDFIEILPATQKPTELLGWCVTVNSEEADTADEFLRFTIQRGHTTSGSGGASNTPRPCDDSAAYGGTVEVGNTTIASAGTSVILHADSIQNKVANIFGPVPDGFGYRVQNAELLVWRLMEAPADDIVVNFTFWIREL